MIGCDSHDATMVLHVAVDRDRPIVKRFPTREAEKLIAWARSFAAERESSRTLFAYEASGLGFGLHDERTAAERWHPRTVGRREPSVDGIVHMYFGLVWLNADRRSHPKRWSSTVVGNWPADRSSVDS